MNTTAISKTARVFGFIVAGLALATAAHLFLASYREFSSFSAFMEYYSSETVLSQLLYLFASPVFAISVIFLALYVFISYGKAKSPALLILSVVFLFVSAAFSFFSDVIWFLEFLSHSYSDSAMESYYLILVGLSLATFVFSLLAMISVIKRKGSTTLAKIAFSFRAFLPVLNICALLTLPDVTFEDYFEYYNYFAMLSVIVFELPFVLFAFCCPPDRARRAMPQPGYSPYQQPQPAGYPPYQQYQQPQYPQYQQPQQTQYQPQQYQPQQYQPQQYQQPQQPQYQPQQNSAEQRNAALQNLQWQYQNGQITLEQYNEEYARLFYQP